MTAQTHHKPGPLYKQLKTTVLKKFPLKHNGFKAHSKLFSPTFDLCNILEQHILLTDFVVEGKAKESETEKAVNQSGVTSTCSLWVTARKDCK